MALKYLLKQCMFSLTRSNQLKDDLALLGEEFEDCYLNVPFPLRQMFGNMRHKFQHTGSVTNVPCSDHLRDVQLEDYLYTIAQAVIIKVDGHDIEHLL